MVSSYWLISFTTELPSSHFIPLSFIRRIPPFPQSQLGDEQNEMESKKKSMPMEDGVEGFSPAADGEY
jgi:hypothetical protein